MENDELIFCKMNVTYADKNISKELIKKYIEDTNPFNSNFETFIKREKVQQQQQENVYLHRYLYYIVKFKVIDESNIEIIEFKAHRLLTFFANNINVLREISESISILNHSVNIGTARENIIESFLRRILPKSIEYYTGELIDNSDNSSGQLDIILHSIFSPKLNLFGTINLFPIETVLGVIEVKSNLDKKNLERAFSSYEKIKGLNNNPNIPFIIIGFKSLTLTKINKNINEIKKENIDYSSISIIGLDKKNYYSLKIDNNDINVEEEKEEKVLFSLFETILKLSNNINDRTKNFDISTYFPKLKTNNEIAFLDLF